MWTLDKYSANGSVDEKKNLYGSAYFLHTCLFVASAEQRTHPAKTVRLVFKFYSIKNVLLYCNKVHLIEVISN